MLYEYAYNPDWRQRWAPHDFVVVCSDTGDEHPATYAHIENVKKWCNEQGIEFVHITKDMGYHTDSWPDLITHYEEYETIGTAGFTGACTQQLKIAPIYKWLDDWIGQKYGFEPGEKRALKAFGRKHGKIRVLIGIADKETKRVPWEERKPEHQREEFAKGRTKKPLTSAELAQLNNPNTWQYWIERKYPLYWDGIDRARAQEIILRHGFQVPPPSNCMRCHFASLLEILWLYRRHPDKFEEWCRLEERKVQRDAQGRPGRGGKLTVIPLEQARFVFGKKSLRQKLAEAMEKYGSWTDEQLSEYKMSHGHCVATRMVA